MLHRMSVLAVPLVVLWAPAAYGQVIVYDSTTATFKGGSRNGGATLQGSNTITVVEADDITPIAAAAGQSVTSFTFRVYNTDTTSAISARPRVRFWDSNGTGGGPGTLLAAFDFGAVTFNANTIRTLAVNSLTPGQLVLPAGTFWAGLTFDNNNGATGATAAQLNSLAQPIYDPPAVGSSQDRVFDTTSAGSFAVSNPPVTIFNSPFVGLPGSPAANFAWQFQVAAVPEPGSLALCAAAAGLALVRRARRRSRP
jgi:hypothetical protein